MFNSNSGSLPVSIPIGVGNGGGFGNGNFFDEIIALAVIGMVFGGNGFFGGFGGTRSGVNDAYVLNSDFATLQRMLSDGFGSVDKALDAQNTGICNLGYTALEQSNQTNMNIMQSANAMMSQLADCCCKTQQNIKDTQYNIATTGAGIQNAIKECLTRFILAIKSCVTYNTVGTYA